MRTTSRLLRSLQGPTPFKAELSALDEETVERDGDAKAHRRICIIEVSRETHAPASYCVWLRRPPRNGRDTGGRASGWRESSR